MIIQLANTIKNNKKFILFHFLTSLAVFAYYLFSPANYGDDYLRIYQNHSWWGTNRYLASLLFNLIGSGTLDLQTTTFMGAFFNMLALLTLSVSAILLLNKFFKVSYATTFFSLGITILPFFNEALFYRYDSFICMSLPILLIACLITSDFKSKYSNYLAIFITTYLIMSIYQVAINIYFSLLILLLIIELASYNGKGNNLKNSLAQFFIHGIIAVSSVAFVLVINKLGVLQLFKLDAELSNWISSRAKLNSSPSALLQDIFNNMQTYSGLMLSPSKFSKLEMLNINNFSVYFLGYFLLITFYITIIYRIITNHHITGKLAYVITSLILFVLLFFAPTTLSIVSGSYAFVPRYYASWLVISLVILNYLFAHVNFSSLLLNRLKITILSTFIILSATYNIKIQAILVKSHHIYSTGATVLISQIINLPIVNNTSSIKQVAFKGSAREDNLLNYQVIYNYMFNLSGLTKILPINLWDIYIDYDANLTTATLLKEDMFYKFYLKEDVLIVEFK